MQNVNWNELLDQAQTGFDPVPDDEYEVEVVEAKPDQSSNGKLMYVVKFNILQGPYQGRKIWNNFVLSPENPNALGFFFKHMKAMGLEREYFAQSPNPEQVAQALLGRRARIKVGHREWGGTLRNDVNDVMPPSGGGAPQAAPQTQAQPPAPGQQAAPQPSPQAAPQPAPQQQQPAPAPQPQPQAQPQQAQPAPAPQPAPQQQPAPQPAPQQQQQAAPQPAPAPQPQQGQQQQQAPPPPQGGDQPAPPQAQGNGQAPAPQQAQGQPQPPF